MTDYKIPFGNAKGTPLSQAEANDIRWVRGKIAEKLAADPDKPYADKDRKFVEAADAELARRNGGGAAPSRAAAAPRGQASQAIERAQSAEVVTGAFRDAHRASEALRNASSRAHLVSPAPACGTLPEGCEITLAAILVDAENETYKVGDKLGLSKVALDKIAGAAGVSWDPRQSGRLDDGSDPHYCHYRAVGTIRLFDGSQRTLSGEVEIDLREGSPQLDEIRSKAEKRREKAEKDGKRYFGDDGARQILEYRKFILRHAESKAKNRAIRSIGVRTGYSEEDLAKPFVVARLQFTGRSEDPEARREFRQLIGQSFLGASNALYGDAPAPRQLGPAAHVPPAVGAVPVDPNAYETDWESAPTHDEPASKPREAAPPPPADEYDRGDSADAY